MSLEALKSSLPWSLRGVSPFLNKYGDGILFRAVSRTPPIECNPKSDTGVHSAVPHRYLFAYLTAIKSFLRYHSDIAVYVHDDGSLLEGDKQLIRKHVPGACIIDRAMADREFEEKVGDEFLAKVRSSYTSYLKLFDPTLFSERHRIVIVDTDVLFLRRPNEIIDWAQHGKMSWYHKSEPWSQKGKIESKEKKPESSQTVHIQKLVVQDLPKINEALGSNYSFVPGFNSGFIGYECGVVDYRELKQLLTELYKKFGNRIFRWGSEQTMHGLVLCAKGARALPSDKYMVYTRSNSERVREATFAHFIGEFRYYQFNYPRLASRTIRELSAVV